MIPRKLTGNASVDAIATMAISGNVIPATWYKTITTASGKADLAAINILSDVLYWYRPSEIRDESTGDVIADLTEDLAAEQKARLTYDNILRLSDDPDVNNVIRFLREREIVHFQRFGECLRLCKEKMNSKNVYLTNPAFDKQMTPQPRNA